jgi:quinol monooxygenase YgiN
MAEIATEVTLINVFNVDPANQERVLQLLIDATDKVICKLPGFVSAAFHRSLDGTQVANYAQWTSKEAFEAMLENPSAQEHMMAIRATARGHRNLFELVSVHQAAGNPSSR